MSLNRLSGYRDLRSLCVYGDFATLEHLDALRELSSLQELSVHDAYMFDADELPQAQVSSQWSLDPGAIILRTRG